MATKKPSLNEVLAFLSTADISAEDHKRIVATINGRLKQKRAAVKAGLSVGDQVTWVSKYGYTQRGTVLRINRTRAIITESTTGSRWSVSITLLNRKA